MNGSKRTLILIVLVIIAFAAVTVLAITTWRRDSHSGSQKATISYAPPGVHREAQEYDGDEDRPQRVALRDLHLDKAMNFNPAKGEEGIITYRLDEPALVTIRVVKEGTRELYLATIANMAYRGVGEHTETWNGLDYSGNIIDMTKACMSIQAVAASSYEPGKMGLEKKSPEEIVHSEYTWGHVHAQHHEYAEEVPILKIVNLTKGEVLSGKVRIETEVDENKRGYGNEYGYGVRYYVDGILAHEEFYKPECDGKFAYELDTTAFEDGEHMLYVGMCDHNEHTTSAGVSIVFNNSRTK